MTCPRCELREAPPGSTYCSDRCYESAKKARHRAREGGDRAADRPFCAWDGEGFDARYVLLQSSAGAQRYDRAGLTTHRCLQTLLGSSKKQNHVWYGFGYDVCLMLMRDIPFAGLRDLYNLQRITWRDYLISYIPHRQFWVKERSTGRTFNSYDAIGFFQCSFITALQEWGIPVPEVVRAGKAARSQMRSWRKRDMIEYNAAECACLVELMDRFRAAMREAGLTISRFDGAGALAAAWMRREDVTRFYGSVPQRMQGAIARALFGGRNDVAAIGHAPKVYSYDRNSAYPADMAQVPDMSQLRWQQIRTRRVPLTPFAIVKLRWSLPIDPKRYWNPLPYRSPKDIVVYPDDGAGWYYAVEVAAADRMLGSTNWRTIERAWVPTDYSMGPRGFPTPLRSAIRRDYALRARWKAQGNPAQVPLRLALNAIYGKCLQRRGYAGHEPKFRNYLWAGYCTARARAALLDAIAAIGQERVLSLTTDQIVALGPLPKGGSHKSRLGAWKREKEVVAIDLCGTGLYQTYSDRGAKLANKRRGWGHLPLNYSAILATWWEGYEPDLELHRFVGIGMATAAPSAFRALLGRFDDTTQPMLCPAYRGTEKRLPNWQLVPGGLTWLRPAPRLHKGLSHPYSPAPRGSQNEREGEGIE